MPKYSKENWLWELPQIWREALYWTSHWEKWYEYYSFLSASAIPVIKWEDQEELTISASEDLACLWMGQEDTKINDLQDQSVLNTCTCRKVLLIACSKKQCWITLPVSQSHELTLFFPAFTPGKKMISSCPYSGSCSFAPSLPSWLCWAACSTGNHEITFLSPLHLYCLQECQVLADRLLCLGTCETERLCQGISSLSEN